MSGTTPELSAVPDSAELAYCKCSFSVLPFTAQFHFPPFQIPTVHVHSGTSLVVSLTILAPKQRPAALTRLSWWVTLCSACLRQHWQVFHTTARSLLQATIMPRAIADMPDITHLQFTIYMQTAWPFQHVRVGSNCCESKQLFFFIYDIVFCTVKSTDGYQFTVFFRFLQNCTISVKVYDVNK